MCLGNGRAKAPSSRIMAWLNITAFRRREPRVELVLGDCQLTLHAKATGMRVARVPNDL
jgi:hypothetical protein